MLRCLAIVGLLALITQGCTKKPENYPMTAFRVDYRTWSCQQLAGEVRSASMPLRWLPNNDQMRKWRISGQKPMQFAEQEP
jgi:hypothetical protein